MNEEKNQLMTAIKAARLWQTMDSSSRLWQRAFSMYHAETGQFLNIKDNCSKCYEKVKTWLEKD